MKNQINCKFIFHLALSIFLIFTSCQFVNAQTVKKAKVRLKAEYIKIMDDASYLNISASARVNKKTIDVSNIELKISNNLEDESFDLGTVTTDLNGNSTFVINDLSKIKADSLHYYNFKISFKGDDNYKKSSKSLSIQDASIKAQIISKDSINQVKAKLYHVQKDSVLSNEIIDVQIQRIFKPLKIGKEFNSTDENGIVIVPIEEGIPGVNGNLTIEVVLKDHDDFGTVKSFVNAPTETVIVDESTFDERKMWSPRNKTPLFLLIFSNLVIFSIWGIILYLIIKLFKINKS